MDFNIKISSDGKLLEKLSEAAGWVTYGSTDFRRAKKTFIDEVQTMDISLFEKAALISNAGKIIKEYRNQQEIVKYAMQVIDGDISPDKLDDDWLTQFMDYAKQVSSEDFQKIWGTILAREAKEPESIPKSLLHTLIQMDRSDAEAFGILCRMTVKFGEEYAPVIWLDKLEAYNKWGIVYDKLIDLDSLGLISLGDTFLVRFCLESERANTDVIYFDKHHNMKDSKKVQVGDVIYTKRGTAMYKALSHGSTEIEGFWEKICLPMFCEANTL